MWKPGFLFRELMVVVNQASKSPKETLSNFPIPRIINLPRNESILSTRRKNGTMSDGVGS